jgi:DNA-directed RNA polymerase specialized sigma24 family protein
MLQPGLWPVLQIDRQPRVCFVLRMLLGYATSSCAQMLAIEEQVVKAALQNAILQLQHAMTAND